MPKRTLQVRKMRRIRNLGFRARAATSGGRRVIKRRIDKGRKKLTVSDEFRLLKKKPKTRTK